uniref:Nuclear receptor domain-containing protein n=1 Tax=Steinernema glaseri TaxID=37863 RepID=A0A1I7Z4D5_9BILA
MSLNKARDPSTSSCSVVEGKAATWINATVFLSTLSCEEGNLSRSMAPSENVDVRMTQRSICGVCAKDVVVLYIYGTVACRACAAFFARSVKEAKEYKCKNSALACGPDSVRGISAVHACKKCRFERCLEVGMKLEYMKPSKRPLEEVPKLIPRARNDQLPLLSSTLKAIDCVNRHRFHTDSSTPFGTSKKPGRYLTGPEYRKSFLENAAVFRHMFDYLPILSDLDSRTKDCMFKNSLSLYSVLMHSLNNAYHLLNGGDTNTFYVFPNKYVYLDDYKLAEYFATYHPDIPERQRMESLLMVGRISKKVMVLQRNALSFAARDHFMTDEDFAAFILLIVIHTNNSSSESPEWKRAIARLTGIWKELDIHYRLTNREASLWGNLFFFLSNLQSVSSEYVELMRIHDLSVGNNMYFRVLNDEKSGH